MCRPALLSALLEGVDTYFFTTIATTNLSRGDPDPCCHGSFHHDRGRNVAGHDPSGGAGLYRDCPSDHGRSFPFGRDSLSPNRAYSCSATRPSGARNPCLGYACPIRRRGSRPCFHCAFVPAPELESLPARTELEIKSSRFSLPSPRSEIEACDSDPLSMRYRLSHVPGVTHFTAPVRPAVHVVPVAVRVHPVAFVAARQAGHRFPHHLRLRWPLVAPYPD